MGDDRKLSIWIPEKQANQNLKQRLAAEGKKQERSINFLVVEAIVKYLEAREA